MGSVDGVRMIRIPFSCSALVLCACATVGAAQTRHPRVHVGGTETCAIASDGAARCWGLLTDGQMGVAAVATREPMRTLEPGVFQACGLSERGEVMCARSMNPDVHMTCPAALCVFPLPQQVSEPLSIVTGGYYHACVLGRSGRAYCWGSNGMGQLGLGWRSADNSGSSGVPIRVPTAVFGNLRFKSISAGEMHTCALTARGDAYCWGYGQSGELGRDTVMTVCSGTLPQPNAPCSVDRPVRVKTSIRFRAISAGMRMTCAISVADVAYCWGHNYRCGLGWCGEPHSPLPSRIALPGKVLQVDAGYWSACAITSDHRAWCWGDNTGAQLGSLVTVPAGRTGCFNGGMCTPAPTEVSSGHRWRSISVGDSHACGVTIEDDVYCWGSRKEGRLANFGGLEICDNRSYDWDDTWCASTPIRLRFATRPFNWAGDMAADFRESMQAISKVEVRDRAAEEQRILRLVTKQALRDVRAGSLDEAVPKPYARVWLVRANALDSATAADFRDAVLITMWGQTASYRDTLIEKLEVGRPRITGNTAVVSVDRGRLWCVNGHLSGVGTVYQYRLFHSVNGWHFMERDRGVIYEPPPPPDTSVAGTWCLQAKR
jgi:hypothetical protein